MKKIISLLFLVLLISLLFLVLLISLSACSNENQNSDEEAKETVGGLDREAKVLAQNLEIPWSIAKSGDVFYLTERTGSIVKVEDGNQTRMRVELSDPLAEVAEAGLMGFVLHPEFNDNSLAFAYYTYTEAGDSINRLVQLKLDGDVWKEERILLDNIPSGQFHQGGRVEIGPDNKLFVTTGDATQEQISQDINAIGGKILRINLDGTIPSDNPFEGSYVYSYGHRNPQGLAWNEAGELYSTEHGPSGFDEINHIQEGKNYGWPLITGDENMAGMQTPVIHSGESTWAPSGADFKDHTLYFAALAGQGIYSYSLNTMKLEKVLGGYGRVRDVLIVGDTLYFVTNNTDGRGVPRENDDKLYQIDLTNLRKN
ncbi:glucose/arabinose dehydrogenase [Bacillus pakistanensis]|uniref:Glucose/arabinose dehydrogenase n=1 Tax=Rossellomorea pakistanensis TaxID=992288 RepID=A0ABS2NBF4_9BACI|nr:sorbosone dehydrogenase family protein [Bacillus pakistanensis]MBM7585177.1 glucose/arabinose dehydrogenase [Bacillus pakistanensis]